jgi:hypothetical protein
MLISLSLLCIVEIVAAVPKLQFWNSNLKFMGKKRALDRFFGSLFQNQQGFGTGSVYTQCFYFAIFRVTPSAILILD